MPADRLAYKLFSFILESMSKQIKLFGVISIQKRDFKGYSALIRRTFMLKIGQALYSFYKNKNEYKELWLVGERGDDARDNGYHFYRYLVEKHPEINARFVITPESKDREKIEKIGRAHV